MNPVEMHVTAVLVSYNRKELLREALAALGAQTRRPDRLIVVDNASDDGATELAADFIAVWGNRGRLIQLTQNTGGAGGFTVGIAAALLPDSDGRMSDWVWVMDDDTVPHPDALENALQAHARFAAAGQDSLAVMGSRVVWTDGNNHPMNTPKPKILAADREKKRAAAAGGTEIRSISFVSAFLRVPRILAEGLPVADYFLWNDDFEYSARLLRGARGLFVPDSVVTHKTKLRGSSDTDPGERFYFEVRNKTWVFNQSRALKLWERNAYRAATVRRWLRTVKNSTNRKQLANCLRRGLRDGIGTKPRYNSEVLLGAGVPDDVAAVIAHLEEPTFKRKTAAGWSSKA
ncbi:glycosyltransferase [Canibacter zhoujuaniae]|uniref:glycosyltransferase n=1 Tax=Canibacter zhoujuaniae TaxID=2708343 RepID=UPI001FBA5DA8|nr:glycosyltransferase [Canibacter zhoujuaniae]